MADDRTRNILRGAYKSQTWKDKVDKMSDAQVYAIYIKFKAQGKL